MRGRCSTSSAGRTTAPDRRRSPRKSRKSWAAQPRSSDINRMSNTTHMATATATKNIGKVVQIIGPVLDIEFESENLPELYNAIEIKARGEGENADINVTSEVQQHIGRNQVRAV